MFPRKIETKLQTTLQFYTNLKIKRAKKQVNKGQIPLFELTEKEKIKCLNELIKRAIEVNESVFNDFKDLKKNKSVNKKWVKSTFALITANVEIEKLEKIKVERVKEQVAKWGIKIDVNKGKMSKTQLKALKTDLGMYRNNKEVRKIMSDLESGKFDREDINKLNSWLKRRNENIARNETGNLYAEEVKDLMIENKQEHYIWRTCGDARVRPEHAEKDGQKFSIYDDLMPGEDFNCRCSSEPIK